MYYKLLMIFAIRILRNHLQSSIDLVQYLNKIIIITLDYIVITNAI